MFHAASLCGAFVWFGRVNVFPGIGPFGSRWRRRGVDDGNQMRLKHDLSARHPNSASAPWANVCGLQSGTRGEIETALTAVPTLALTGEWDGLDRWAGQVGWMRWTDAKGGIRADLELQWFGGSWLAGRLADWLGATLHPDLGWTFLQLVSSPDLHPDPDQGQGSQRRKGRSGGMAWKLVTVGFFGYVRAALWPEQLSERELLIAPSHLALSL